MSALFYTNGNETIGVVAPLLVFYTLLALITVIIVYFHLRRLKKSEKYLKIETPSEPLDDSVKFYTQLFEWANHQTKTPRYILQVFMLLSVVVIVTAFVSAFFGQINFALACFIALFNLYVLFSVSASERLIREMNVRQLSENIEHANNEGYIDQLFFVHQSGQDIIYVDLDSDNQDRFYKICKMGKQWYLAPADKDFDLQNENTIPIQLKLGLLKDTDYIKVFTSADMFEADSKEKQSYTILYNEYE